MTPTMRAYLPLERSQLVDLDEGISIRAGVAAYGVTALLRSVNPAEDEEQLEFIALQQAARHAATQGRPVIIAAVDLPASVQTFADDLPFVTAGQVPASEVVSFHLSDEALDGVEAPDPQPVEETAVRELSWFDITELSQLLHRYFVDSNEG